MKNGLKKFLAHFGGGIDRVTDKGFMDLWYQAVIAAIVDLDFWKLYRKRWSILSDSENQTNLLNNDYLE